MVGDLKKTIAGDAPVRLEELERRHVLALENRVDRLKSKLLHQGFVHLCRFAERKNRLARRYFFRASLKRN